MLDTSWTPGADERPGVVPIRPTLESVVERVNLFDESLERLDEWAAAAGLADVLTADGVTWWFHARGFTRLAVHELLLWRHVLDELAPPGRYSSIVVPPDREHLVAAARAGAARSGAPRVVIAGTPTGVRAMIRRIASRVRRRRPRPEPGPPARRRARTWRRPDDEERARRLAMLDSRISDLAAEAGGVLAILRAHSFHVIDTEAGSLRGDPYVGPVVDRLARDGVPVVKVVAGLDYRRDADWEAIERDDQLLPMAAIRRRLRPTPAERSDEGAVERRLAECAHSPMGVNGVDIGPAVAAVVRELAPWFERQRRDQVAAREFMGHLRPGALFTGWEAARTSWLGAARQLGIPSVAVQHGVIYPNTPDYCRPWHGALVRPDITCVFGPYERDLLVEQGGYEAGSVVVTGSPRAHAEDDLVLRARSERAAVRRLLGVAPSDRLLVVSTARHAVGDEIHGMTMVGRLLGGPLPGVSVVFKLHPEEDEEGGARYLDLLAGLARAGAYPAPRTSAVRDIDIYRLLVAADAHLGQYSTVLTDAVLTSTPNMIAVGQAWSDVIGYVAAGVAVPVRTVDDVRAFMAEPQPPPPENRERFLEAHFQPGDAAGRIAASIRGVMAR